MNSLSSYGKNNREKYKEKKRLRKLESIAWEDD